MPAPRSSLLRVLLRPIDAASELLMFQLRLRRRGRGWAVVLERPRAGAGEAPQDAVSNGLACERQEQAMSAELRSLLGQHRNTRNFMRHLAYVERALRLGGAQALEKVPLEVQQRALEQLENLVIDWSNPGLAELRRQLISAVADRQADAASSFQPTGTDRSDFLASRRLQVSEASASDFESLRQRFAAPDKPRD